jgi:hypothetical protein
MCCLMVTPPVISDARCTVDKRRRGDLYQRRYDYSDEESDMTFGQTWGMVLGITALFAIFGLWLDRRARRLEREENAAKTPTP